MRLSILYYKHCVMAKTPCQVIVWETLPAIRAALAVELVRNGVSQLEAAKLLDMVPSAISQYITKKRGYRIEFDDEVMAQIKHLAQEVKDGEVDEIVPKICEICKYLRELDGSSCENSKKSCRI